MQLLNGEFVWSLIRQIQTHDLSRLHYGNIDYFFVQ